MQNYNLKFKNELEQVKCQASALLQSLCTRCKDGIQHVCPVREIRKQIEAIRGVPVIVNDKLWHVVFN